MAELQLRDTAIGTFVSLRLTEVCQQLRRSAGYNKRYYDIGVRPSRFEAGQWVWYYNPRKYPGRQMKWAQQYEGPYLVLKMLSPLVAKIQQSSRSKPKIVHIDKLKEYEGVAPRMWPTAIVAVDAQRDGGQKEVTDPYAVLLGNERSEAECHGFGGSPPF